MGASQAPAAQPAAHPATMSLAAAAAFAAVASPAIGSHAPFWVLAVIYLLVQLGSDQWRAEARQPAEFESGHRIPAATTLIVAALAVLITLLANRPDADDALYLNAAVSALDHSTLPLLRFDGMHGEAGVPFLQSIYKPQTYEILIAAVSRLTSLQVATVYYVAAPSVFAVAFAIAHALVFRRLLGPLAHIALIATAVVLLAWGESHRVFGNFAFVRLYQGKAVFVTVMVPLIVYFALRFVDRPGWRSWLLLFLAQVAAVGFTSSAAVVAPVASGLAILAGTPRPDRQWRLVLAGALASGHAAVTVFLLWLDARADGPMFFSGVILGLPSVIGGGLRGSLALIAFMLLPSLSRRTGLDATDWLSRYVLISVIVLLNPVIVPLIGHNLVGAMSWRLYWAVPFPMFLGAAAATAILLIRQSKHRQGRLIAAAAVGTAILFLIAGRWTVSPGNDVQLAWPGSKVDAIAFEVAADIVAATPNDGLVLAPPSVAVVLTGFHDAPPIVGVRFHYSQILARHWGVEEAGSREALTRFVDGQDDGVQAEWVLAEIDRRGVTTIVTPLDAEFDPVFIDGLRLRGFDGNQAGGYQIWVLRNAD